MGVTIHFEGRLKDAEALKRVIDAAKRTGWKDKRIEEAHVTLERVRDEAEWDYTGPTYGIELQPHENCEPLRLEFDCDLYVQEYVKTQFAPPETHMAIVHFLKAIAPEFDALQVFDEGEYWDTGSIDVLTYHIDSCERALQEVLETNASARGPLRLPSGRIVDFLE